MIGINVDGIIIGSLVWLVSIVILLGFLLFFIITTTFRIYVYKHKLKFIFVTLILLWQHILLVPNYYAWYKDYRLSIKLEEYSKKYTILTKQTTIQGTTYPVGSNFEAWVIDPPNNIEFTQVSFTDEFLYQGLYVEKIQNVHKNIRISLDTKNEQYLKLSKNQFIQGWWCDAANSITINRTNGKAELIKCLLSKNVKQVAGITLANSNGISIQKNNKNNSWTLFEYPGIRMYGLKFFNYSLTVNAAASEMIKFSAKLNEDSIINGIKYQKGGYINTDIFLTHIHKLDGAKSRIN